MSVGVDQDPVSLTSIDLLVSLRVPAAWEVSAVEPHLLELSGPDDDGYHPTLTLTPGVAEEPGSDWFHGFVDALPAALVASGVELVDVSLQRLSSPGSELVLAVVRRPVTDGPVPLPALTQVQAWAWSPTGRMVALAGAATTAREDHDVPGLVAAVRSLRLLPARP